MSRTYPEILDRRRDLVHALAREIREVRDRPQPRGLRRTSWNIAKCFERLYAIAKLLGVEPEDERAFEKGR